MVGIAPPLSASVLVDGSALAGAMSPVRLLHSGIDKKQTLARPGLAKNTRPIVEQAAELAAAPGPVHRQAPLVQGLHK